MTTFHEKVTRERCLIGSRLGKRKLLIEERWRLRWWEGKKETKVKKWIDGEEKVRANEVDQRRDKGMLYGRGGRERDSPVLRASYHVLFIDESHAINGSPEEWRGCHFHYLSSLACLPARSPPLPSPPYLCPWNTSWDSSSTFHTLRLRSLVPAVTGRSRWRQSMDDKPSWCPNL